MTIRIPRKGDKTRWIHVFDVDGDTSRYETADAKPREQIQDSPLINASINPREYIQLGINGIHGSPVVISAYEIQGSNDKKHEDAHRFALQNGLYVPTPFIFMTYFKRVISAKNKTGQLVYADGSSVPSSEVEEMYKHLTTNHKDVFSVNNFGAWTWLNAQFKQGTLETIIGIDSNGNFTKQSVPLEVCVPEDCFATLDMNSQGLPVKKSLEQKYKAGENIYFWYPRENAVAWFGARSDGAGLNCYWGPGGRDGALGVFGCAEGAAQK